MRTPFTFVASDDIVIMDDPSSTATRVYISTPGGHVDLAHEGDAWTLRRARASDPVLPVGTYDICIEHTTGALDAWELDVVPGLERGEVGA